MTKSVHNNLCDNIYDYPSLSLLGRPARKRQKPKRINSTKEQEKENMKKERYGKRETERKIIRKKEDGEREREREKE